MITKFKIFETNNNDDIVNVKCNWCDWFGNETELEILSEDYEDLVSEEICPECKNNDCLMDINLSELIDEDFIDYMNNNKSIPNINKKNYKDIIDYYKDLYPLYFESKKYNL